MGSARLVDGDLQHLRLLRKLGVMLLDLRGRLAELGSPA